MRTAAGGRQRTDVGWKVTGIGVGAARPFPPVLVPCFGQHEPLALCEGEEPLCRLGTRVHVIEPAAGPHHAPTPTPGCGMPPPQSAAAWPPPRTEAGRLGGEGEERRLWRRLGFGVWGAGRDREEPAARDIARGFGRDPARPPACPSPETIWRAQPPSKHPRRHIPPTLRLGFPLAEGKSKSQSPLTGGSPRRWRGAARYPHCDAGRGSAGRTLRGRSRRQQATWWRKAFPQKSVEASGFELQKVWLLRSAICGGTAAA